MTKPAADPSAKAANPFAQCLYFTANAVARHVTRLADEAFAPVGLCPSAALLLKLVVDSPGLAPTDAARVLHLAPSSVTRFADGLERRGLVERRHEGRQVLLDPTRAGRDLMIEVQVCWEELYEAYTQRVGKRRGQSVAKELAQVAELLDRSQD